jgi:hypothetical protein
MIPSTNNEIKMCGPPREKITNTNKCEGAGEIIHL